MAPHIAKLANEARLKGIAEPVRFPRPMTDRPGLDFSFSGLKTYTLNTVQKQKTEGLLDEATKAAIALAFENAVVDTLRIKCQRALALTGFKTLVIAGGVSANTHLREILETMVKPLGANVFYARPEFCTDNGAMIAYAGCQRLLAGERSDLSIQVKPRWPISDLTKLEGVSV